MTAKAGQPPAAAVVLSLYDTGVATARCLGRRGVPVEGYDADARMPGFRSRYCRSAVCPHPTDDPEGLLQFLLERGDPSRPKVLFPASDEYVLFTSRHREALGERYRFLLPGRTVTETVVGKTGQLRLVEALGIEVPATCEADSIESLERLKGQLRYPALIKAVHGYEWKRHYATKGFEVRDEGELVARCGDVFSKGIRVVVQEIIAGPCSNNFEVSVYVNSAGDTAASLTVRKIRQYPSDFGFGTMTVSTRNEEVEAQAQAILRGLEWRGFANIEFKFDTATGTYKFIELNPRVWQQVGQAESLGLNFPHICCLDLAGARTVSRGQNPSGVKWIDLKFDTMTSLAMIARREMSVLEWVRSLRGVRSLGLFAVDDPVPFLHSVGYGAGVFKLFKQLRRLFGGR